MVGLAVLAAAAEEPPAVAVLEAHGYDAFYNLDYGQAIADFRALTAAEPDSAGAWNHLTQAVLYQEMYRIGALESELYGHGDPFLQEKLLPPNPKAEAEIALDNQRAQTLAEAEVARNPMDAQAHYDLAVAWGLRGNLAFSIQKSYWAALSDAKSARREAARAIALDPQRVDPVLILGVHNYVAGSLPLSAKVFSTLVGYRGDKEKGRQQIAYVAAHGEHARTDASVLLAVVDRRDGLNRSAVPILLQLAAEYPRNVLFAVETAEAMEAAGEHDAARAQYQLVLSRAASDAPGYNRAPLDKVWYDLGNIERVYSNWQRAAEDFQRVETLPHAQPRYRQAAELAAGEVDERAGLSSQARTEFAHCVAADPSSAVGRAAASALRH
jgi:tetratricopeptide (TPR) repeat protein